MCINIAGLDLNCVVIYFVFNQISSLISTPTKSGISNYAKLLKNLTIPEHQKLTKMLNKKTRYSPKCYRKEQYLTQHVS